MQIWSGCSYIFIFIFIYLAVLGLSLVAAWRTFVVASGIFFVFTCGKRTLSCGMWDLVPWPGIEPRPPALGARSLSHWTTREVPRTVCILSVFYKLTFLRPNKYQVTSQTCHIVLEQSLSSVELLPFWTGRFHVVWAVLCLMRCLAASLTSTR